MGIVNPVRGVPGSDVQGAGDTKEVNALTQLLNEFNGNIDDFNLKPTAGIYSVYKMLYERGVNIGGASSTSAAGTYPLAPYDMALQTAPSTPSNQVVFYLDPADYAIAGRTAKLRLRAWLATNATAPGITFTIGLYPIVLSAATQTFGAVVPGSTVAFVSPGASNSGAVASSGDFAFPAAGFYALGVVLSGVAASGSVERVRADLQMHHTA